MQQRGLRVRALRIVAQDAEDGTDAAADVEVRGSVERIEQHAVAALPARVSADDDRLLVLLRGDDGHALAPAQQAQQHVVRDHVELLLLLALHVAAARLAEHVLEPRAAHLVADDLRGDGHRREDPRQRARGARDARLLGEQVALDGDDGLRGVEGLQWIDPHVHFPLAAHPVVTGWLTRPGSRPTARSSR
jgi:hypothetical protein